METKFFDLSHVTPKITEITIQLFNSCRLIEKDSKGKFNWVAFEISGNGINAKKVRI